MTGGEAVLYDYWRSSASYRVRIALNLKGVAWRARPVDLLAGAHKQPDHLARQPQGLVPALAIDGHMLTQSLAIAEYLDETRPDPPLLPADPLGRQRVRALAHVVAMDIHPICNAGVANHVAALVGDGDATRAAWMQRFIGQGLAALEAMLADPATGRFCHGDVPTLADCCLVPQVYNARRWDVPVPARVAAIAAACEGIEAFAAAHPDRVRP
ncbi:MAG: maleylacetoacetate isomerase [Alphaproteobacteria bacterium]